MNTPLPLLLLSGCLVTHSDLTTKEEAECAPQVSALEQACRERNGLVRETAQKLKACLGEEVKIMCSWGDAFEADILTIEKR